MPNATPTRPRERRSPGPLERAALATNAGGEKRRHVLCVLARIADEGRTDPSIRELARRCRRHRMEVVLVLDKLAAQGLIEIDRATRHGERSSYRLRITPHERTNP